MVPYDLKIMIVKLLGLVDLLTAILFFLAWLEIYPIKLAIVVIILLILKSLMFIKSFTSILDLIGAVFLIIAMAFNFYMIDWLFMLWFLQKGSFSLV